MTSLFWLIFAHSIGDLALQSYSMGDRKGRFPMVMLGHCVIWAGCLGVALLFQGKFNLWKMAFLISSHFITDTISWNKCHKKGREVWNRVNFYDQVAHFIQIVIVWGI